MLVVEDDCSLRHTLARGLAEHHMSVTTAEDGRAALAVLADRAVDVIMLDIGLPDSDGRDVCQALRARGIATPVLFLTARGQVGDVLSGFAAGGDDYLAKPFHFQELLARVTALSRRIEPPTAPGPAETHLDPRTHQLVCPAGVMNLTPTEFRLLAALMGAPGQVLRRQALVNTAWPAGARVSDNTLDQYIARLRRKLAAAGDERSIATVYGVGYKFSP